MTAISTAAHTAHLDELPNVGLLLQPDPLHDVAGLHGADWNSMIKHLREHGGWAPVWDDGEDPYSDYLVVGHDASGCEVYALERPDAASMYGEAERLKALRSLARHAGVTLI